MSLNNIYKVLIISFDRQRQVMTTMSKVTLVLCLIGKQLL